MLSKLRNLRPVINNDAEFNLREELDKDFREPNISYNYDYYKLSNLTPIKNFTKDYNIINIAKNYANANNILQVSYDFNTTLTIFSSINKKNIGNIKLTCIDNLKPNVEEKNMIDIAYPYQFMMVYNSILYMSKQLVDTSYNLIYITLPMTDEDLYTVLLNFVKYYDVPIIITNLTRLDVIKFFINNYNVVISEIGSNRDKITVDMKFVKEDVEKFSNFGSYGDSSIY